MFLKTPFWLLAGRASFKTKVAQLSKLDPQHLPYREAVLDIIRRERDKGRRIVLATASHMTTAQKIADHLQLFDQVIATDESTNLKGSLKASALVENFGEAGFDYIGDHAVDLQVWKQARRSIVVETGNSLTQQVKKLGKDCETVRIQGATAKDFIKGIRVHQWAKNVLIFLPPLLGHQLFEAEVLMESLAAFFAFSFAASAIYVVNDLFDLHADRAHPIKRRRPFASGRLTITNALMIVAIMLALAGFISLSLSPMFPATILAYLILTTAYSVWLKQVAITDVIILAILYTTRLLAGSVATDVAVSTWLLTFSTFFFLSLAFMKRVSELRLILDRFKNSRDYRVQDLSVKGRDYQIDDLQQLQSLGAASGYIAVLVFCLYITSTAVQRLYDKPEFLWLICPMILYWISRAWFITNRGRMHSDPVAFALTDRISYCVTVAALAVWFMAWLNPFGVP
jgi:4-hydroxybenzoate polyprenyltransferase